MNQEALDKLKAEIANDPAGRGYAGKTASEIADLVNAPWIEAGAPIKQLATVSPSEFFGRFTPDEAAAIEAARGSNKILAWFFKQLDLAQGRIDLADLRIQQGLGMLVQGGLLTNARKNAILAAPPDLPGPDIEHNPRVMVIFAGVEGAPNAVTPDDVKAVQ